LISPVASLFAAASPANNINFALKFLNRLLDVHCAGLSAHQLF